MVTVLKTVVPFGGTVGSNPTPSAALPGIYDIAIAYIVFTLEPS